MDHSLQCMGRFLGKIGWYPSVPKSNPLHVHIFRLCFLDFEVNSLNSSEVLNFNWLFVTSGRFLPIHWFCMSELLIVFCIEDATILQMRHLGWVTRGYVIPEKCMFVWKICVKTSGHMSVMSKNLMDIGLQFNKLWSTKGEVALTIEVEEQSKCMTFGC